MSKEFITSKKIAVAMSGGVDSSVVAAFLKSQGADVFGITMDINETSCFGIEDAKEICKKLQIPHYVFDLKKEFKEKVIDVFKEYYRKGLTPNPCAFCNRDIKFGLLLDLSKKAGADFLATGHYAKLKRDGQNVILKESENKSKDQSYFLSLVPKENFKSVIFPLQEIQDKGEVRENARNFGFHNAAKKDSQDICFIQKSYKDLFKDLPESKGDIIFSGKKVGEHKGLENFTIGQRKGLGISNNEPLYVVRLDQQTNSVVLGLKNELDKKEFLVRDVNWFIDPVDDFEALAKVRSMCLKTKANVKRLDDETLAVNSRSATGAPIAPGQVCCFYNENSEVLAAGIISF